MDKKQLKELIYADMFRNNGGSENKSVVSNYFNCPGFRYMYILRHYKYYHHKNIFLFLLYRHLYNKYSYKYGYEIPMATQIGKGFYICHFGGVVINSEVVIGNNVNISKGCTIGQTNRGKRKGTPTIGSKVWIGTNAVIVGKITIGDNVLIAPNSYVNFDVPDNSIVLGNPGRIISNLNATEGYINNIVE